MIKLEINPKLTRLAMELDKVIAGYKAPGRMVGAPDNEPKINEPELIELMKKGDVVVAPNVHCYFIESPTYDERKVKTAAQALFPGNNLISVSGRFHYPKKEGEFSSFMGWHTNSNMGGWRVYATRTEEDNKSFFRYYSKGRVITEWEKKGWNFRAFKVDKKPYYWHCVYSETDRYSFGFRFEL